MAKKKQKPKVTVPFILLGIILGTKLELDCEEGDLEVIIAYHYKPNDLAKKVFPADFIAECEKAYAIPYDETEYPPSSILINMQTGCVDLCVDIDPDGDSEGYKIQLQEYEVNWK